MSDEAQAALIWFSFLAVIFVLGALAIREWLLPTPSEKDKDDGR